MRGHLFLALVRHCRAARTSCGFVDSVFDPRNPDERTRTPSNMKNRLTFLLSILTFMLACSPAHAQAVPRNRTNAEAASADAPTKAIEALKHLQGHVIVYRSLADFEAGGKLARVPLQIFEERLREVRAAVEPLLDQMPAGKSKRELANALDSYRDGVFWWRQIDQPRVVNVSALAYAESNRTPTDTAFLSSIPYTVAIHWRQAEKYLKQAEHDLSHR
jgi:hypothetical protein